MNDNAANSWSASMGHKIFLTVLLPFVIVMAITEAVWAQVKDIPFWIKNRVVQEWCSYLVIMRRKS